jgi:hypothetical protein
MKVNGGRLSPEKVYPETVVRIDIQPGWGGVWATAGVGAGVVLASVWVVVWKGRMVMLRRLEVGRLDAERVIVAVVAWTKDVVVLKIVELLVSGIEELVAKTEETWDDAVASGVPIHPTNTPLVVFIGTAKHPVPLAQTDITYAPPNPSVSSQCPKFPSIQAIPPILHIELKSNVAKNLLYAAASAVFALKIAGETVPAAGGADVMAVGAGAVIGRPVETSGIPGAWLAIAARGFTMGVQMQWSLVQSPPMRLTGGEFMIVPLEEQ